MPDDRSAEIISRLDVLAEYAALGVQFTSEPNPNGWADCRAVGREDNDPSAGVNVLTGRYKDHGGAGDNLSLWDFAAANGPFPDWKAAKKHYAEKAGVDYHVSFDAQRPDRHLQWLPWNWSVANLWCRAKGGFIPEAIHYVGGRLAKYRYHWYVIAFPVWGPQLDDADPCGWVLVEVQDGLLPIFEKNRREPARWERKKTTGGSQAGLMNLNALKQLGSPGVELAFKTEGLTDMLSLLCAVPPAMRLRHLVTANSGGANEYPRDTLLARFADCPLVSVIGDCDEAGQAGGERWAGAMARHCQDVRRPVLPYPIVRAHGRDVRNFLHDYSYQDLLQLTYQSPPVAPQIITPLEAPDDPHRLATLFLETQVADEHYTLRYWHEEFWRWRDGCYSRISLSVIRAELTQVIKQEFDRLNVDELTDYTGNKPPTSRKVTGELLRNVLSAIQSKAIIGDRVNMPVWLGASTHEWSATEIFATRNGLIHLPSLVDSYDDYLAPPTPRFFSAGAVDYSFDMAQAAPNWVAFLNQVWPGDAESIRTLQEWFGYCLLPDTRQQKILLFAGPKRSGKGTTARVLKSLLGDTLVSAPSLSDLGKNFGLESLIGKTLAIVPDARLSGRADATQIVERLLQISGEDPVEIDRKNRPAITAAKLSVRFFILTNELPNLRDVSGAFASRIVLLRSKQSFYGFEDLDLQQRLAQEMPGILIWAIQGWERLRNRGHFVQPQSSRDFLAEMEELSSPITAFVNHCCVLEPEESILTDQLYNMWCRWCHDTGIRRPGSQSVFGRDLMAAYHVVSKRRFRNPEGQREMWYLGVGPADQYAPQNYRPWNGYDGGEF